MEVLFAVDSTNEYLYAAVAPQAGRPPIVLAEIQRAGRGRRGRSWCAPFGSGLTFSIAWTYADLPAQLSALGLAVGVTVADTLRAEGAGEATLKWPNDVVWRHRKLGGLLIQLRLEAGGAASVVVGLGLNLVLPDEARASLVGPDATPVADLREALGGRMPGRNALAGRLVAAMCGGLERYGQEGFAPYAASWQDLDSLSGAEVRVTQSAGSVEGRSLGADRDGALLVEVGGRVERYYAGDVSLRAAQGQGLIVKRVGGAEYVYAQGRMADGATRQVYLAPHDDAGQALVERFRQARADAAAEKSAIDMTAKALRAAGMMRLDAVEWRVVNALAEDGIFRVGGVLVGTIAYRCIVNYLGVRLSSASAVTADVDIAGKTIPVVIIPEVVCPQTALDRLEMGFSPMMEADPALFGSRFKARQGEFKVEFLTPLTGRNSAAGKRFEIRQLNVPAVPLRFLDYLIEDAVPAVALGRRPVLGNVPQPARYAVHKLIVSQVRGRGFALKAQKDLEQSFDLGSLRRCQDRLSRFHWEYRTRGRDTTIPRECETTPGW